LRRGNTASRGRLALCRHHHCSHRVAVEACGQQRGCLYILYSLVERGRLSHSAWECEWTGAKECTLNSGTSQASNSLHDIERIFKPIHLMFNPSFMYSKIPSLNAFHAHLPLTPNMHSFPPTTPSCSRSSNHQHSKYQPLP
jgi:hypothetical protein